MVVLIGLLAGTTGCDWWPPTLQERIGQQEQQLKVAGEGLTGHLR